MTDNGPSLSRFTAPWQLEIVPTSTAAAAPLAPAACTISSPSSTASTANVPTPNTWWRHTNSAGPCTGSPAARSRSASPRTASPISQVRALPLARPRRGGGAEERGEVGVPRGDRKRPVGRLSELRPRAAGGVAVHDDHPPESGLPLLLRLGELTGVERAVAAAPDDDHVPHHDDVAHPISRPPSTTSVVPVT